MTLSPLLRSLAPIPRRRGGACESDQHIALPVPRFVALTLSLLFSARKSTGSIAYFAAGRRITAGKRPRRRGRLHERGHFLSHLGDDRVFRLRRFMYWSAGSSRISPCSSSSPSRCARRKYHDGRLARLPLKQRPVRAMASLSTLTVSPFYMWRQMVAPVCS